MHRDGCSVPANMVKYRELLRNAADYGCVEAIMETVTSIPEDEIESRIGEILSWWAKAVECGSVEAMRYLGDAYSTSKAVPVDAGRAVRCYTAAAEHGDLNSMCYLGAMYQTGEIVAKDVAQAAQWYQRMVELEDPSGLLSLGLLHREGEGVPKSEYKAKEPFEAAVKLGSFAAMRCLGDLYPGLGVIPQDLVQAYLWHNLATSEQDDSVRVRREIEPSRCRASKSPWPKNCPTIG